MPITLENYQARAIGELAKRRRALVKSAAGSGKTIIAAGGLAAVIALKERDRKVRIGWMASTSDQIDQGIAAVNLFPIIAEKAEIKFACAAAQTDWSDRDILIVDEAHNGLAPTWQAQIKTCNARWAMTATPEMDGDRAAAQALLDLFGGHLIKIERSEVQHRLAKARVIMLDAFDDGLGQRIDDTIEAKMRQAKRWSKMPEFQLRQRISWQVIRSLGIHQNKMRNAAIIELAKHHAENHVLILVCTIKHGRELEKKIPHARFCTAKSGKAVRRRLIEEFKEGKLPCLIATSLADEGLDAPIADVEILASGGRSSTKTEQRSGRILRKYPGKEYSILYDFKDSANATMAKHSRMRQAVYRHLGYIMDGELPLNIV